MLGLPLMTSDVISDLIVLVAREDRAAFRALYSQAGSKLMGVLVRILKDRQEAEDALQETFTRVWLKARAYDPARGSGLSWMIAMARNLAIDRLRARAPLTEDELRTLAEIGALNALSEHRRAAL